MRGRLFLDQVAPGVLAGVVLSGCAMVDHSNTLLFGTNTAVGVQVGVDANNVPSVNIGYKRQEAVFLPLQANLKKNKDFVPCPGTATVTADLAASCKFIARNGEGQAEDAYSVLASFGAKIEGGTENGAKASVGLAQYFATGTAAQLLALKGGAAVIAVGEAAAKSAEAEPSPAAVAALVGNTDTIAAAQRAVAERAAKRKEFGDYVQGLAADKYNAELDALSTKAGRPSTFLRTMYCKKLSQAECAKKIRAPIFDSYVDEFYVAWKGQGG